MSSPAVSGRGAVGVVTAVSGPTESAVAAALSGRRDLCLVRRCADVAELLSVAEAGLAFVAVLSEAFPGIDADVVDRVRLTGCAVVGVVDPDRESSERLRAWGVTVVDVDPGAAPVPRPDGAADAAGEVLARAVLAAGTAGPAGAAGAAGTDLDGRAGGPGEAGSRLPGTGGRHTGAGGRGEPGGPGGAGGRGGPGGPLGTSGYSSPTGDVSRVGATDRAQTGAPVDAVEGPVAGPRGRLVAVWGPAGAPGRTTVAVHVAAELAARGAQVLLVDADTYASSVAQVLGMLDESPGLVAAVRAGLDGRLDATMLARLAPTVSPGLRVLTGLTRAGRWSELRPAGLQAVWASGRRLVDHVVVDLAPPLEEDDELSYDTAAPRRNGATLEVLRAADDVLVVGSADPVGLQRLVRALQELAAVAPGAAPQVVVNRVRADSVGRNPRLRVREALDRFAGVRDLRLVPDDRPATDRALLAGRTLAEVAPASPARVGLRAVADGLREAAERARPVAAGRATGG